MKTQHQIAAQLNDLQAARSFLDMAIRETERAITAKPDDDNSPTLLLRRAQQDIDDVYAMIGHYAHRDIA